MLGAQNMQGLYIVSCLQELPNITFALGGQDFSLSAEDLVIDRLGFACVLGLQSISLHSPMWILGDVFMRKYYVQFDWGQRRIGFALSSAAKEVAEDYVQGGTIALTWSDCGDSSYHGKATGL